jgi:hypothetical protein
MANTEAEPGNLISLVVAYRQYSEASNLTRVRLCGGDIAAAPIAGLKPSKGRTAARWFG